MTGLRGGGFAVTERSGGGFGVTERSGGGFGVTGRRGREENAGDQALPGAGAVSGCAG